MPSFLSSRLPAAGKDHEKDVAFPLLQLLGFPTALIGIRKLRSARLEVQFLRRYKTPPQTPNYGTVAGGPGRAMGDTVVLDLQQFVK